VKTAKQSPKRPKKVAQPPGGKPAERSVPAAASTAPPPGRRGPKVDVEQTARRKREIIHRAAALFDKVGYHGVNMNMIAEAAGLKKPTLYHYISGKDEILFGLHELMIGTLQRNTDARLAAGADTMEILRGVVVDVFKLIHDYPGFVRAFFEHFRELSHPQRAQIAIKRDAFIAVILGVIKKAMAEGILNKADPRLTANCLFSVCNWAYQWYRPNKDPAPEELADQCWNIIRRGLAAR
jgi:AcrR family transcriptional regulator